MSKFATNLNLMDALQDRLVVREAFLRGVLAVCQRRVPWYDVTGLFTIYKSINDLLILAPTGAIKDEGGIVFSGRFGSSAEYGNIEVMPIHYFAAAQPGTSPTLVEDLMREAGWVQETVMDTTWPKSPDIREIWTPSMVTCRTCPNFLRCKGSL